MLEGRLDEFRLGDVFQLLAWTGKSGALTVDAGQRRGRVDFSGGQIAFAVADVRRAELGARLASMGVVDAEGLRRVVEAQLAGPGRVAEVLREVGLEEHVVDETLRQHVQDAVFTLMRTADGGFSFEPCEEPGDQDGPRLGTDALIAEGARRLEEWEGVRQRIPSPDAVLAMTPSPPADGGSVTVSADQWRLLVLVDGARSVAELVELTGQGEFATSQVLAELVEAGLLDAVDPADGDTGLGRLLARRDSLRELEASELGSAAEEPQPDVLRRDIDVPAVPGTHAPVELSLVPEAGPWPGTELELEPWPGSGLELESDPELDLQPDLHAQLEPEPLPEPESVRPPESEPQLASESQPESEPRRDAPPVFDLGPLPHFDRESTPDGEPGSFDDLPLDAGLPPWDGDPEPVGHIAPPEEPPASVADAARPDVDRVQVARELASLGFEGPPATPAPTTDEPQRRLSRDEDVTRGLLVRLMDGVRKA